MSHKIISSRPNTNVQCCYAHFIFKALDKSGTTNNYGLVQLLNDESSVVNKDFVHQDQDNDSTVKDQDQDQDLPLKDQDQDQDLALKDQDKDKDLSVKDKDKDKDLSKYSIKDHLERYLYGAEISMF